MPIHSVIGGTVRYGRLEFVVSISLLASVHALQACTDSKRGESADAGRTTEAGLPDAAVDAASRGQGGSSSGSAPKSDASAGDSAPPSFTLDLCNGLCLTLAMCGLDSTSRAGCDTDCLEAIAMADATSAACGAATRALFQCGVPLRGCTTLNDYYYVRGGTPCDPQEKQVDDVCGYPDAGGFGVFSGGAPLGAGGAHAGTGGSAAVAEGGRDGGGETSSGGAAGSGGSGGAAGSSGAGGSGGPACPAFPSPGALCIAPEMFGSSPECDRHVYSCKGTYPNCNCGGAALPPPDATKSCTTHAECPGGICYVFPPACGVPGKCSIGRSCLDGNTGTDTRVCGCDGKTYPTECEALAAGNISETFGACTGSHPGGPVLASGQGFPTGIAVDAVNVYWTAESGGTVMKVPIQGGTPVTLAAGQNTPAAIAVDATNVYWIDQNGLTLMKVPIAGGTPVTLATGKSPYGLAVGATSVYWADETAGAIMKTPIAGGASVNFATTSGPFSMAIDATNVYWFSDGSGTIVKEPIAGGTATPLGNVSSSGGFGPQDIAVDATSVYWTNDFSVVKVPIAGGASTTLSSTSGGIAICVDSTNVYWAAGTKVMKVGINGGTPVAFASGLTDAFGITLDATNVYFTDAMAGTINKMPK
jgi:hypothetical protein